MKREPEMIGNSIKWFSKTIFVDIDTGKLITRKEGQDKSKYIKLKTKKHVTINKEKSHGTIEYTIECRKQPQGKLFT